MTYEETINILQLKETVSTQKELKKAYHTMAKHYHSDLGNVKSDTMMKLINSAYSWAKEHLPITYKHHKETNSISEDIEKAIDAIKHLQNISIELCGTWLWVTGDTKPHKDIFKSNGFGWSGKKSSWFIKPQGESTFRYRGKKSLDEIRSRYGSQNIQPKRSYMVTA